MAVGRRRQRWHSSERERESARDESDGRERGNASILSRRNSLHSAYRRRKAGSFTSILKYSRNLKNSKAAFYESLGIKVAMFEDHFLFVMCSCSSCQLRGCCAVRWNINKKRHSANGLALPHFLLRIVLMESII